MTPDGKRNAALWTAPAALMDKDTPGAPDQDQSSAGLTAFSRFAKAAQRQIRKLTVPKEFNLSTSKRAAARQPESAKKEWKSLAQLVKEFQSKTPPRFRKPYHLSQSTPNPPVPHLTEPKSPTLRTSQRHNHGHSTPSSSDTQQPAAATEFVSVAESAANFSGTLRSASATSRRNAALWSSGTHSEVFTDYATGARPLHSLNRSIDASDFRGARRHRSFSARGSPAEAISKLQVSIPEDPSQPEAPLPSRSPSFNTPSSARRPLPHHRHSLPSLSAHPISSGAPPTATPSPKPAAPRPRTAHTEPPPVRGSAPSPLPVARTPTSRQSSAPPPRWSSSTRVKPSPHPPSLSNNPTPSSSAPFRRPTTPAATATPRSPLPATPKDTPHTPTADLTPQASDPHPSTPASAKRHSTDATPSSPMPLGTTDLSPAIPPSTSPDAPPVPPQTTPHPPIRTSSVQPHPLPECDQPPTPDMPLPDPLHPPTWSTSASMSGDHTDPLDALPEPTQTDPPAPSSPPLPVAAPSSPPLPVTAPSSSPGPNPANSSSTPVHSRPCAIDEDDLDEDPPASPSDPTPPASAAAAAPPAAAPAQDVDAVAVAAAAAAMAATAAMSQTVPSNGASEVVSEPVAELAVEVSEPQAEQQQAPSEQNGTADEEHMPVVAADPSMGGANDGSAEAPLPGIEADVMPDVQVARDQASKAVAAALAAAARGDAAGRSKSPLEAGTESPLSDATDGSATARRRRQRRLWVLDQDGEDVTIASGEVLQVPGSNK